LSEAAVDEMVGELYDMPGMDFGVYAKPDGIYVRAIAKSDTEAEALKTLMTAEEKIRNALGEYIWGTDEDEPPKRVGDLLREKKYKVAVMESCTGGMVGAAITDIAGSSDYFVGGAITYTPESKVDAGVPAETIRDFGVVSEETAAAMANAACQKFGADCAISVTGVAGPGDQGEIKAGTVYIGVATPEGVTVERYQFPSRRPLVRNRAVTAALLQMVKALS
ncbi:MAG: nicotinamide-nucleotide amidohydrolase family protein, partial [Chloroflexi bacterium]|nr:nicotinamide-nucleotide amidohydrolase family protein [Chloroflexota bacterium]